jgi:nicotinate phosphoribosyltransferase
MSQVFTDGASSGLFTDLYELTMAQAYLAEGMVAPATFSLFFRNLPDERNYVLSCGAEDVADFLASVRFQASEIDYLRDQGLFSEEFLARLRDFRFSGEMRAVPDGTPVFPEEPLVEVTAPIAEAQLMETWVMNQVHAQSVLATKASRVVTAAAGRAVLDFGLRRIHGAEAGVKAARAFHVAGVDATSNVLAGQRYGLPISGTMAHSYVQAHDSEMAAFRAFARQFPRTVLLVDTYDTLNAVRRVTALARELGDDFQVRGVRLDSGDLGALARESRRILDEAGLQQVKIFASGGIDEQQIAALVEEQAPIDGFGVGTAMGVSQDAPSLDIAYKLVDYAGVGRMKLSAGKEILPGAKQVVRVHNAGRAVRDVIARREEAVGGVPLLEAFVVGGQRVRERESADEARRRARAALGALPAEVRSIRRAAQPYPVERSPGIQADLQAVRERVRRIAEAP